MFSLPKLLAKDDRFSRLLEGSDEEAQARTRGVAEMLKTPEQKRSLHAFVELRELLENVFDHRRYLGKLFFTLS